MGVQLNRCDLWLYHSQIINYTEQPMALHPCKTTIHHIQITITSTMTSKPSVYIHCNIHVMYTKESSKTDGNIRSGQASRKWATGPRQFCFRLFIMHFIWDLFHFRKGVHPDKGYSCKQKYTIQYTHECVMYTKRIEYTESTSQHTLQFTDWRHDW